MLTIENFYFAQFACNLSARFIANNHFSWKKFKCHTSGKCGRLRYFSFSVEKYVGLKNENEGYHLKVHFDNKTRITLGRQKIVEK